MECKAARRATSLWPTHRPSARWRLKVTVGPRPETAVAGQGAAQAKLATEQVSPLLLSGLLLLLQPLLVLVLPYGWLPGERVRLSSSQPYRTATGVPVLP